MTRYLRRRGHSAAFCTVDRLMRVFGMNGVIRGRRHCTTIPSKDGIRAGDRLNRDFGAQAPNLVWVADFTYVSTWTGWAYVAFVFDVFSRSIVGRTVSSTKATALVSKALNMAIWRRDHYGHPIEPGLIHHSDAGSRYTSAMFTESLALQGLSASIGSVGDAYDNALAESIIGLFKTEVVRRQGPFKTVNGAKTRSADGPSRCHRTRRSSSSAPPTSATTGWLCSTASSAMPQSPNLTWTASTMRLSDVL